MTEAFEATLATTERGVDAALRSAAAATRELRKALAGAKTGQVRDLRRALAAGVGRIIVDSFHEIARLTALETGEVAPDFTLPTLDHRERVTLSSHRGRRPVVLVFGSYT